MAIISCELCAFHKDKAQDYKTPYVSGTHRWIECHRKPPTVVCTPDGTTQVWPQVEPDEWCGDWSVTFK